MGNTQSKERLLFISAGVLLTGVAVYVLSWSRSFEARLNRAVDAIGKIAGETRIVPADKLMQILITVFKFSYEFKKEEKMKRRVERIQLLNEKRYEEYVMKLMESYKFDQQCEQEVLNTVLSRLNISKAMYDLSCDRDKTTMQRQQLSVAALDALEINVTLSKDEAHRLNDDYTSLVQSTNPDYYVPKTIESEGKKIMGERWKETLKTMIVLDKLYDQYGLNGKEIAATLRKYGIGMT